MTVGTGDGSLAPPVTGLCRLALRMLPVDGVSVVLIADSVRTLVGAAGQLTAELEAVTAVCMEGPGVEAPRLGIPVVVTDLAAGGSQPRWPVFAAEAAGLGVSAVVAVPIRIGVIRLGVMVAHRLEPGDLGGTVSELLRLSETAAYLLLDLQEGSGHRPTGDVGIESGDTASDQELTNFIGAEIHQASGMVMVQLDIPIDAALDRGARPCVRHRETIGRGCSRDRQPGTAF